MIRKINAIEFEKLYEKMLLAFPPSEMKSLEEFKNLLEEGKYICFGCYQENVMMGYALGLVTTDNIFWLDYLNIFNEYQSKGCGRTFVREILEDVAKCGIFLEVEEPLNDDYNDDQNRRMRFYDKFNIHKVDCKYLFPCTDGTYIETLNLMFIPAHGVTFVSKETLQNSIREAVSTIHKALPHAQGVMEKYVNDVKDLSLNIFTLEDVDMSNQKDIEDIGRLIYLTDPYVYPAFYENSIDLSVKCAKSMLSRETLFNHKFIKVGKINGHVAGFMVILEKYVSSNPKEMELAMKESLGYLTPKFDHVMEGYFNTLDYEWEGLQIMSLAVLPEFRGKHVATKMLNSLPNKNTYSLACVKDNKNARELYRKCGFEFKFEYPGYTDIPCVELVRKGK